MIQPDQAILVVSVLFTVLLAILTIAQIVMIIKLINPLNLPTNKKYGVVLVLVILIALLIAHIATACGPDGVGKDNLNVLLPGAFAIVFAVTSALTLVFSHKLGDKALMFYTMSFVLLWICVIVHIVSRVLL